MGDLNSHEVSPDIVREALDLIVARTGVDFRSYSPAMVPRRLRNHMLALGVTDAGEYLSRLHDSPHLVRDALGKLTIKVSRFYRNPAVFDRLRDDILPHLSRVSPQRPLRIWCAGGGGGEEPYTIAMLLRELAIDGEILVTDIDVDALETASRACYANARRDELPASLQRFCEPTSTPNRWRVADEVRALVRFARHDLTGSATLDADAFDLVSCRNVLIYFQREAQHRALRHLAGALRHDGVLLLGEAEWPPADLQHRLPAIAPSLRLFQHRMIAECVA